MRRRMLYGTRSSVKIFVADKAKLEEDEKEQISITETEETTNDEFIPSYMQSSNFRRRSALD